MSRHWVLSKQFAKTPVPGPSLEERMRAVSPELTEPEKEDKGLRSGSCPYCEAHGMYEHAPWLRKTGAHHAIATSEQQRLFDPEKYK